MAGEIEKIEMFFKQISRELNVNVPNASYKTVRDITNVMKASAMEDYLRKRKTKSPSRHIIPSFGSFVGLPIPKGNGIDVRGQVFAGGGEAYYAIYLEEGHVTRDKKKNLDGYKFMEFGFKAGVSSANRILNYHFNNAFTNIYIK